MRQRIRLSETDLNRIIKQSVNRILKEGVEYNGEGQEDEVMFYMERINNVYEEIGTLIHSMKNGGGKSLGKDVEVLRRYIKMMWAHINKIQKEIGATPTMGQVLDEPTPLVHY